MSMSGFIQQNDVKGSILWMAPELLMHGKVARRNDIWSLGCTMIELASGKHPWSEVADITQLFGMLEKKEMPVVPSHLSKKC